MADQPLIRVTNLITFKQNSWRYTGIKSVGINVNKGKIDAVKNEGEFYPTGSVTRGITEFPVVITVQAESAAFLIPLLAEPKGTCIILGTIVGGTTRTITISNMEFEGSNESLQRDADGMYSVTGKAHATPGADTTLPIVIT